MFPNRVEPSQGRSPAAWTVVRWSISRCASAPLVKQPQLRAEFDGLCVRSRAAERPRPGSTEVRRGVRRVALDAIHHGMETSIRIDVGPELMRLGNRLESVGGLTHDSQFGPLLEHLAEHLFARRRSSSTIRILSARAARVRLAIAGSGFARLSTTASADPRGAIKRNRVPRRGALSMSKRPPSSVSRSRMLNRPHPTWPAFVRSTSPAGSNPIPLSDTVMHRVSSGRSTKSTATRSTCACLTALKRSSRTDSNRRVRTSFRSELASGSADTWTTNPYRCRIRSPSQVKASGNPEVVEDRRKQLEAQDRAAAIASSR